jgi:hypothetical protein
MTTNDDWCCKNIPLPQHMHTEGDITFYKDGTFRIVNRLFNPGAAVDFRWNGCHAFREAGDSRLCVKAGDELFVFEYVWLQWYRWIPVSKSPTGDFDVTTLPRRPDETCGCLLMMLAFLIYLVVGLVKEFF